MMWKKYATDDNTVVAMSSGEKMSRTERFFISAEIVGIAAMAACPMRTSERLILPRALAGCFCAAASH